jgi:hypothetical protein
MNLYKVNNNRFKVTSYSQDNFYIQIKHTYYNFINFLNNVNMLLYQEKLQKTQFIY